MDLIITHYKDKLISAYFDNANKNRLIKMSVSSIQNLASNVGDIYLGRIKNIVKNINAAFVEIANGEICFLQFSDKTDIKKYHNEMDIVVQVTTEAIKTKQATVTTNINLTGKFLIKTHKNEIAVSSKIKNVSKKKELISLLENEGATGFIIRTNAGDASAEDILKEYNYLNNLYNEVYKKAEHSLAHSLLYRLSFEECEVRDCYDNEIDRIITDDKSIFENIKNYTAKTWPWLNEKISLYTDESFPLNAMYSLNTKIERALSKKVWLDSGAYLIIEPTEACTVIDVNTGKAVKKGKDKEKHFLEINKEAAKEAMLQISLRNLSGIILIDFIDMKEETSNEELIKYLRTLASCDSVKTTVVDMTALGLIEITRKKMYKPLHEMIKL